MKPYKKISSFKDLIVWQQAHKLTLEIYNLSRSFPKEELFSLTNQLRRAALSITSNIAEGFSRQSPKEKIHFYYVARGSLTEVENQLTLAKDLEYLPEQTYASLEGQVISIQRLLNRLITSTKSRRNP